ncbi:ABC transporter [Paenibacillus pini JCM 16418]|uniref:ABC transporter n=1 Tax=Paenibacillus pini JCM 16418 TaxID=1236976 RepID=W7YSA3_9BACL|nr:ABC transporter [Paenibacillus pini JCM 16418]
MRGLLGKATAPKPKNFKGTLHRLWQYFGHERKLLSFILLLIIVDAGVTLTAPYLIGHSIDAMSSNGLAGMGIVNFKLLKILIIVLLVAYVTDAVLVFLQGWLMAGVSQRIVASLRRSLFGKLQKLPVSYFDARSMGKL